MISSQRRDFFTITDVTFLTDRSRRSERGKKHGQGGELRIPVKDEAGAVDGSDSLMVCG